MAEGFKLRADGIEDLIARLRNLQDDQLPYITARALTVIAQRGQAASRALEKGVFTNRNDWTVRNTKITPATKENLRSEVYTDTSNWSTGAPDYLVMQDEGGEKIPFGRDHLAIPTKFLRQLAGGIGKPIPDWLRPKALLEYAERNGKYQIVHGKLQGSLRGTPRAIKGMYFFKVTFKSGATGILMREQFDARNVVYPMYIFVTRAHLRKRFAMEDVVVKVIDAEFWQVFAKIAEEALSDIKLS